MTDTKYPLTTRAYRMEPIGSTPSIRPVEDEVPQLTSGHVLVRVRATSMNFRDPALAAGTYPFHVEPDLVALSDGAGEVVAIGTNVRRFAVGDRVANHFTANWYGGSLRAPGEFYNTTRDGWLTTYKVVHEDALVRVPDYLTFEEAATLPCASVTAWSALQGVGPGDTVLTQGTSSVSLFAVQLARAFGARVVSTTSDPAKAQLLTGLGASAVVNYRETPNWGEVVREATGGRGVDLVVEIGGESSIAQSIASLAYRGTISQVGLMEPTGQGMRMDQFFMRQARLRAIPVGSRSDLEDALRVFEAHEIHPTIDRVFDFDDALDAWDYFASPGRVGKVVIRH